MLRSLQEKIHVKKRRAANQEKQGLFASVNKTCVTKLYHDLYRCGMPPSRAAYLVFTVLPHLPSAESVNQGEQTIEQ